MINVYKNRKLILAMLEKSNVVASARLSDDFFIRPERVGLNEWLVFHNCGDLDHYIFSSQLSYIYKIPHYDSELVEVNNNIKEYHDHGSLECNCKFRYHFVIRIDKCIVYNSRKTMAVLDLFFTPKYAIIMFQPVKIYSSKDYWKPFRKFEYDFKKIDLPFMKNSFC